MEDPQKPGSEDYRAQSAATPTPQGKAARSATSVRKKLTFVAVLIFALLVYWLLTRPGSSDTANISSPVPRPDPTSEGIPAQPSKNRTSLPDNSVRGDASHESKAKDLFFQARAACLAIGLEITTNGTALKCDAQKAISLYRQGLALNPQDADAHTNLGNLLLFTKNYEAAKQQYVDALSLEPTNPEYMLRVAEVLEHLGEHQKSEQMYERASRSAKPDDVDYLEHLAEIKENAGDLSSAVKYFHRACQLGYQDACFSEMSASSRLETDEVPVHPKPKNSRGVNRPTPHEGAQNCCDCGPELSNNDCFLKCNAMIPRCRD